MHLSWAQDGRKGAFEAGNLVVWLLARHCTAQLVVSASTVHVITAAQLSTKGSHQRYSRADLQIRFAIQRLCLDVRQISC